MRRRRGCRLNLGTAAVKIDFAVQVNLVGIGGTIDKQSGNIVDGNAINQGLDQIGSRSQHGQQRNRDEALFVRPGQFDQGADGARLVASIG